MLVRHYLCFSMVCTSLSNSVFQVVLSNATSVPLELRFDIPFGVSPKVSSLEGKMSFISFLYPSAMDLVLMVLHH